MLLFPLLIEQMTQPIEMIDKLVGSGYNFDPICKWSDNAVGCLCNEIHFQINIPISIKWEC
jgi:hypothetical protein